MILELGLDVLPEAAVYVPQYRDLADAAVAKFINHLPEQERLGAVVTLMLRAHSAALRLGKREDVDHA